MWEGFFCLHTYPSPLIFVSSTQKEVIKPGMLAQKATEAGWWKSSPLAHFTAEEANPRPERDLMTHKLELALENSGSKAKAQILWHVTNAYKSMRRNTSRKMWKDFKENMNDI